MQDSQAKSGTETGKASDVPERHQAGWLDKMDSRLSLARDLRLRFDEVCSDLGGRDRLSYMQRSLIERALWLEYWLAQQEKELASGGDFEVAKWTQAANSLQGIYSKLGLHRQAREAPDLQQWIAKREADK